MMEQEKWRKEDQDFFNFQEISGSYECKNARFDF